MVGTRVSGQGRRALTLAEREVEVVGRTAVTGRALEAWPAHTMARVRVTGLTGCTGARALAGCGSPRSIRQGWEGYGD